MAGTERVHRYSVDRRALSTSRGFGLPADVLEVLMVEGATPVCVVFRCPCGCGALARLWTQYAKEKKAIPHWDISFNGKGEVTLSPSVESDEGCGAHFRIVNNNVEMVS